jgi:hypothetical protein
MISIPISYVSYNAPINIKWTPLSLNGNQYLALVTATIYLFIEFIIKLIISVRAWILKHI